jgi:hypothetical protein
MKQRVSVWGGAAQTLTRQDAAKDGLRALRARHAPAPSPSFFLPSDAPAPPERVCKPEPVRHVRSPLAKQARYYFSTLGILDIVYVARKYFFDSFFGTAPKLCR